MALKLDMKNAFDRVEWHFLEIFMQKMNFPNYSIHLIMSCVTMVSYSDFLNGIPTCSFTLSRGIQQGGPLSLYLLILCFVGCSALFYALIGGLPFLIFFLQMIHSYLLKQISPRQKN